MQSMIFSCFSSFSWFLANLSCRALISWLFLSNCSNSDGSWLCTDCDVSGESVWGWVWTGGDVRAGVSATSDVGGESPVLTPMEAIVWVSEEEVEGWGVFFLIEVLSLSSSLEVLVFDLFLDGLFFLVGCCAGSSSELELEELEELEEESPSSLSGELDSSLFAGLQIALCLTLFDRENASLQCLQYHFGSFLLTFLRNSSKGISSWCLLKWSL